MAKTMRVEVNDGDVLGSLRGFLKAVLGQADVGAVLTPLRLPHKNAVMPALVTDPERLDRADPLAPAFPLNGARLLTRLTRRPLGGRAAALMRPCEIRAFVELVKLKQGAPDDLILLGMDCLGAYTNTDYARESVDDLDEASREFCRAALAGDGAASPGPDLAAACRVCDHPVPDGADVVVGLYGVDVHQEILLMADTPKGEELLSGLGLPETPRPAARAEAIQKLVAERTAARDQMFAQTQSSVDSLEKLSAFLSGCVNCYNCRVACPVCYCRECVFTTDVFDHEPYQYLNWAHRKGAVKMPTDTVFFHLTRLAHMSTACVGCGQCSNACPNDVPVMELFRTVAAGTQRAFDYEAGRSLEEAPPLSVFREDEFQDVAGLG